MTDFKDERLQFEGKWDQMRGRVKEAWGALSDDDLDRTEGKWDQVVGTIKEKTGESMDAIERRLRDLSSR
ncbi:MAG: CsbD family protein [Actinomycetota bacterium]